MDLYESRLLILGLGGLVLIGGVVLCSTSSGPERPAYTQPPPEYAVTNPPPQLPQGLAEKPTAPIGNPELLPPGPPPATEGALTKIAKEALQNPEKPPAAPVAPPPPPRDPNQGYDVPRDKASAAMACMQKCVPKYDICLGRCSVDDLPCEQRCEAAKSACENKCL